MLAIQKKGNLWLTVVSGSCAVTAVAVKKFISEAHVRAFWATGPQCWTNVPAEQNPLGRNWTAEDYRKSIDFHFPDRWELQGTHIWYQLLFHSVWHVFIPWAPASRCISSSPTRLTASWRRKS